MNLIGGTIGAIIGGVVGAGIWAGIAYGLHVEVAWIALGVGALVGLGMRLGAGQQENMLPGVIAVVVAVLSLLAGKWMTVNFVLSEFFDEDQLIVARICDVVVAEREESGQQVLMPTREPKSIKDLYPKDVWGRAESRWNALTGAEQAALRELPDRANVDYLLSYIADGLVVEAEDAGRALVWPEGKDYDTAWRRADYPADIWTEAESFWSSMGESEQQDYRRDVDLYLIQEHQAGMAAMRSMASNEGFFASFSPFDLLFFGLAIVTAFKVGAASGE